MDRIKDIISEYRNYLIYGIAIVIILIIFVLFCFSNSNHNDNDNMLASSNSNHTTQNFNKNSSSSFSNSFSKNHSNEIVVDVKGAVKHPGVYQLSSSLRIDDAVEIAGGFIKRSDRNHINLAQRLKDQQIIYVPFLGEIKSKLIENTNINSSSADTSDNNSTSKSNSKININTANENELQNIDGIGAKKATKIIAYRKEHGNFTKIEDIKNISGFGNRSFENIKNFISV